MSPFRLAITEISADLTSFVFRTTSPRRDNLPPCFLACSRATVVSTFYPTSNESHLRVLWRRRQQLIPKRRCLYHSIPRHIPEDNKPSVITTNLYLTCSKNFARFWDVTFIGRKSTESLELYLHSPMFACGVYRDFNFINILSTYQYWSYIKQRT